MTTLASQPQATQPRPKSLKDLLEGLGNVPPERVLADPPPGTATERDVIALDDHEDRLCELIDGTLVEKAMGYKESVLAGVLIYLLNEFVIPRDLGIVAGPDGMMRLSPRRVRIPDVSFVSWSRLPDRRIPSEPIPDLVPDLAVEILSPSNTKAEMDIKRREYFTAGVRLVWIVDLDSRTINVHRPGAAPRILDETQALDGELVLPGFVLPIGQLFSRLPGA